MEGTHSLVRIDDGVPRSVLGLTALYVPYSPRLPYMCAIFGRDYLICAIFGRDCLICAIFARQRMEGTDRLVHLEDGVPRSVLCLPLRPPPTLTSRPAKFVMWVSKVFMLPTQLRHAGYEPR